MQNNSHRYLIVGLAVLFLSITACINVRRPQPPHPTPTVREVHISVWGNGDLVPASGTLALDDAAMTILQGRVVEGRVFFGPLPADVLYTHGAWLSLYHEDFLPFRGRVILAPDIDVSLTARPRLAAIVQRGLFFGAQQGSEPVRRLNLVGASDFNLYARYLKEGEAVVRAILLDREGFNLLRIFLQFDIAFPEEHIRLYPPEHPQYYEKLPAFLELLAQYGKYAMLTVTTDALRLGLTPQWQREHSWRVAQAVRGSPNVLWEQGNEYGSHGGTDWDLTIPPPGGIFASSGSVGSDQFPDQLGLPLWNYSQYHSNDAFEWQRKVGHNAMEFADYTGKPVCASENTRYPDRDSSIARAYGASAGAALLVGCSVYHFIGGRVSRLMSPAERAGAQAWQAGARSIPLYCQDGPYRRRDDLLTPEWLRVYQRGTDEACIAKIPY